MTSARGPSSAASDSPMTPEPHPMSRILNFGFSSCGSSICSGSELLGASVRSDSVVGSSIEVGLGVSFLLASSRAISTSSSVSGRGMSARPSVLNSLR